ncbi:MAG: alpha-glucosidase [Phycisphaerales bacterium]|nr:alpha-glucosidase [Phycisphaerales bacterium]
MPARTSSWRLDPQPALIGDRTARHRDPAHAIEPLPPFPAYIAQPLEAGPAPYSSSSPRPRFANHGGLRHIHIPIDPGTSLYGTGEIAGPLRRNGRTSVCWNTDNFDYSDKSRSLYQSHPFVLAVRRDGSAFGVICETTFWCRIDLRSGIAFACRGHSPAITIIERDTPQEVITALADLTGTIPMPPRWALGYHQCRWSYEPDSRVRQLAQTFRDHRIPCDVIWMDIDYMDGFRCFTFDPAKFPDPDRLNADLHTLGFHTVWMIDPGIKVDQGYFVYGQGRDGSKNKTGLTTEAQRTQREELAEGQSNASTQPALAEDNPTSASSLCPLCLCGESSSYFVRNHHGQEHQGSVWPGPCAFPDFTSAPVRAWWAGLYHDYLATGIDGVWNDMNEPAIFDGPGKSMPTSCIHDADEDLGGPDTHDRYHNIYGMQMVRATREGMQAASPDRRIFVLTRSNFLGGQRYAATWTGDNRSNWHHLRWAIPMTLNLGLSGQPLAGPDIGGFVGEATPELFARFMGIGSLLPFARAHSIKGSNDHEPWSFGADCELACRLALQRRYRLIPYLYTLTHQAATTGLPIARPIWFADPADPSLRGIDDAFLLGPDLLVVAAIDPHNPNPPDSPLRGWREIEFADDSADPKITPGPRVHAQLPRLFIRPGAIIPLANPAQHTAAIDFTTLTLLAAPDDSGHAHGTLYNDDGATRAHERSAFETLTFDISPSIPTLIRQQRTHTGFPQHANATTAIFITADNTITRAQLA